MKNVQAAKALGWFSIGLGMMELAAPRWLGRQIGVGESPRVMRAVGLREVATGVAVLARPQRAAGLWARVGGDALDLTMLALGGRHGRKGRIGFAMGAVALVGLLDFLFARRLQQGS
jgi:hypothetical protein